MDINICENVIANMLNGFAHCRGILDEKGDLIDWVYEEINPIFETLTGLQEAKGKKVSELVPNLHTLDPEIFTIYGRVMKTKQPEKFTTYVHAMKIWFSISVYSVEDGTFTAIFDNITDSKKIEAELNRMHRNLLHAYDETIAGWGKALEIRDVFTRGHTERVTELSMRLGRFVGLENGELENLQRGAFLHDIGKMGIPDAILLKREYLTPEEMTIIKQHPIIGYRMLRGIPFLEMAAMIPYCHHERWNGNGYPNGLMGSAIPYLARLFAVCDVYDALVSDRPYRISWEKARVIDYLIGEKAISFDPEIVDQFVELVGRG